MKRMVQKGVLSLLVLAMVISPALAVSSFPDVSEDATYSEAMAYLKETGIMCGDDKGNFNPDKTVTRAEMAVILCNMLGEAENLTADGSVFTDVPANHWANPYVVRVADLGLVTGYGNGRFGPADTVTYEQALTMLINSYGGGDAAKEQGGYPDGYIKTASDSGLSQNVFAQKGDALMRWQVAMILYNTFR